MAQKSGAVAMINESNYSVRPNSGYSLMSSMRPNLDGLVHVPIMLATIPIASIYVQFNFIVVKVRFLMH